LYFTDPISERGWPVPRLRPTHWNNGVLEPERIFSPLARTRLFPGKHGFSRNSRLKTSVKHAALTLIVLELLAQIRNDGEDYHLIDLSTAQSLSPFKGMNIIRLPSIVKVSSRCVE